MKERKRKRETSSIYIVKSGACSVGSRQAETCMGPVKGGGGGGYIKV